MARFAPVCPPQVYFGLQRDKQFGDYHLLLAHDIVKRPADYSLLFAGGQSGEAARSGEPWTVILDNSVIELGNAVDLDMITTAALTVKPTTTVLPDVLLDCDATIKSCLDAYDNWTIRFQKAGLVPSFMIIPQGTNLEEWISCAEVFAFKEHINFWGIPRNVVNTDIGTRIGLPAQCRALNPYRRIHLLGFSDNVPDDITTIAMNPFVAGIDSAVPVRAVSQDIPSSIASYCDMPPRGDWWNTVQYEDDMAESVRLARQWFRQGS